MLIVKANKAPKPVEQQPRQYPTCDDAEVKANTVFHL